MKNSEEYLKLIVSEKLKFFNTFFPKSSFDFILLNPYENNVIYSSNHNFLNYSKEILSHFKTKSDLKSDVSLHYIDHTNLFSKTENRLKNEEKIFNYTCNDALYIQFSIKDNPYLIVRVHSWLDKQSLLTANAITKINNDALFNICCQKEKDIIYELNEFIYSSAIKKNKKLESELINKTEIINKGNIELLSLSKISTQFNELFSYNDLIFSAIQQTNNVLNYSFCNLLLLSFSEGPKFFYGTNCKLRKKDMQTLIKNSVMSLAPFKKGLSEDDKIISQHRVFNQENLYPKATICFDNCINIPLIVKNKVFGIFNIYFEKDYIIPQYETSFLTIIFNEISTHLYRLNLVQKAEENKLKTIIEGMSEVVMLVDKSHNISVINKFGSAFLSELNIDKKVQFLKIMEKLELKSHYLNSIENNITVQEDFIYEEKNYSIQFTPVIDQQTSFKETVVTIRDFTEIQTINRIKTQRLNVIAKLNNIINSISNLDNLTSVLMEFILSISNAEMGSIQIKNNDRFETIVHSNFPDKIREQYKFNDHTSITKHCIETQEKIIINPYQNFKHVTQKVRIQLDFYICLPIIVKKELIGIINIAKKAEKMASLLSQDDLDTLYTITDISGAAIKNAILFQDSIHQQKLEQELKVAYNIQQDLLPISLPVFGNVDIHAFSKPARDIGGDYYDFFQLDENHLGIIIADIIGKGVPAGLFMAMLKSILHTNIYNIFSPLAAIEKINTIFYKDTVINKYIPLFYGILNKKTLEFTYTNAGHEPAILLHNKKILNLDTLGYPVGAFENGFYEEKTLTLNKNSILMLFTDGIIENKNQKNAFFDLTGLKATLKQYQHLSSEHLIKHIQNKIETQSQLKELHDDLTLIVLKMQQNNQDQNILIETRQTIVSSNKDQIKKVRQIVEDISKQMEFEASEIFNIKLAINEVHANIIEHSYKDNNSHDIHFQFFIYTNKLVVKIRDFSKSLNQKSIKTEKDLKELEGSGLGNFLIKSIMDNVEYIQDKKIGNEVILTKIKKMQ